MLFYLLFNRKGAGSVQVSPVMASARSWAMFRSQTVSQKSCMSALIYLNIFLLMCKWNIILICCKHSVGLLTFWVVQGKSLLKMVSLMLSLQESIQNWYRLLSVWNKVAICTWRHVQEQLWLVEEGTQVIDDAILRHCHQFLCSNTVFGAIAGKGSDPFRAFCFWGWSGSGVLEGCFK